MPPLDRSKDWWLARCENEPDVVIGAGVPDMSEQTFGQRAVGLDFNPSGDDAVTTCKVGFADLIDQMDALRADAGNSEKARLASAAITHMQTAQMWAVKAITYRH